MNLIKILALTALVACLSLAAFADSNAVFSNLDGTITASHSDDLTLTNSKLSSISNLPGYNCGSVSACNGTVSFTTGQSMMAGGSLTGNATFSGAGSSFTISELSGAVQFTGVFTNATWTESNAGTASEYWTFVGTIMDGTLKENGLVVESNVNGATIQLTTVGGVPVIIGGHYTWTDSGGNTNFPAPVPEPGTLTLLGSGLVGIGLFARRKFSRKAPVSE